MKCQHCGEPLKPGAKYCGNCGAPVEGQNFEAAAALAEGGGMLIGSAARKARLEADYSGQTIISPRAYNAILVGTVLWGLLINAILCVTVGNVYRFINPWLFLLLYIVVAFIGIKVATGSDKPIISFLGYNLIVIPFGLVISTLVDTVGGVQSTVVTNAFIYTLLITVGMLGASMAFPNLFSKLGGALFACLLGAILCEMILLLLGRAQGLMDWFVAGLFSLYIGYDIHRSQQYAMTVDNAVDCALDLYLDIANLFIRLVRILSRSRRN